nr:hypothetical protein [Phyllobacterium sp. OV277]
MQFWADDCQYYAFPDQLLANGAAEIRERHIVRFKEPNLLGKLLKRIAVGTMVVDQEVNAHVPRGSRRGGCHCHL